MLTIYMECDACGRALGTPIMQMCDADALAIQVSPCKTCLDREEEKAQKTGYKDGYSEGFDTGRAERGD